MTAARTAAALTILATTALFAYVECVRLARGLS